MSDSRPTDPRQRFADTAIDLLSTDERAALVYAEISGRYFADAEAQSPGRVINVGIREQLLVSVGAGLSLSGMRPMMHTFAPFLVERAYEQIKLDFAHQDVGGLLVSTGGSFDMPIAGRTHQTGADVALIDAVPGFAIHVPGHADEVEQLMRLAVADGGRHYLRVVAQQNSSPHVTPDGSLTVLRRGASDLLVLAVGPMLDATLAAVADLDATVLYASTVRPLDTAGLRAVATVSPDVVVVEPYLAGTSAHPVGDALSDRPHRLLSLGTPRAELRRYGEAEQHIAAAGLDAAGIGGAIRRWRDTTLAAG